MADRDHEWGAGSLEGALRGALEMVPFAMLIADAGGRVLGVNRQWCDLSGLDHERSLGRGWLEALTGDSRMRLQADIDRVVTDGGAVTSDHQLTASGAPRWSRWWLGRQDRESGGPLVTMATADVDDDYARQANLYHMATHDALTGLANRSHFFDSIEQALRRNERQARRVGVVYVDLDGFKHVNDQGGHSLGDRVLLAISSRLRHAVRGADTVARIGGDEFAVLCEGLTEVEQAEVVAQRIEHALAESVELDGERWLVPASVGAAVDRGGPDTAEALMDRADRAMYSAKHARRETAEPASPSPAVVADRPTADPAAANGSAHPAAQPDPPDVAGLRDSLASVRTLLDRLLATDRATIDIRQPGSADRRA